MNFKKILFIFFTVVFYISVAGILNANAEDLSLTPASTQQRRMWTQKNYDSNDWVYEPWSLTFWGRVSYLRFASNDVDASRIKKATVRMDARARESEKEVYLAALNISDTSALKVETNLNSLSSTNRVTTTASATKLMLDRSGYYLPEIASTVVSYTKAIAENTSTTENIYPESNIGIEFNYPLEIELDVTDSVKEAFTKGNHMQYVLIAAKDVYTSDGENLYDIAEFDSFANGVVYDSRGKVLKTVDSRLSLDTSVPVCGNAGFYSAYDIEDPYFSWVYILHDSIRLDIEYVTEEDVFKEFADSISDAEDFKNNVDTISSLLDENAFSLYNKMKDDESINEKLFALLNGEISLSEFKNKFAETVEEHYWGGRGLVIDIKTDLGGRRGTISVNGKDTVPQSVYALIKAYNSNGDLLRNYTTYVKKGIGYYNVYTDEDNIANVEITLTSDKEGKYSISVTKNITIEPLKLSPVFITEAAIKQVKTYYPDSTAQNIGEYKRSFQFVELCNYTDEAVDLKDYSFVYNTDREHTFNWIWEDGASSMLNPGEIYVIGVYSTDTAALGLGYNTNDELKKYWEEFGETYGVTVSVGNRVLIACVESGKTTAESHELSYLPLSSEAGVTVTAEIRKNGECVNKVYLEEDGVVDKGFSYQFLPSAKESEYEEFLFSTGNFPFALLDEQKLNYCEKVYHSTTEALKVMSYNVLATNEAGRTVNERFPLFIRTIKNYDVDIFGMQEVNYLWISHLKGDSLLDYGCIEGYSTSVKNYDTIPANIWDLMNPIYYKKDKFTLLESGKAFLTPDGLRATKQWDSINMKRTMTWAVLENKESGEVTTVINAHLVLSGKEAKVEQVKLLYKKGEQLKKKYGGGIVILGDHNFMENTEPYIEYLKGGVVADSKYLTTNHVSKATDTTFGQYTATYGSPIDFCMISPGDYIVEKYEVFDGVYTDGTVSDHSAVYTELLEKNTADIPFAKVMSYDKENNTANIQFNNNGDCVVVFADYDGDKLLNTNALNLRINGICFEEIVNTNTGFTLDKGDKIFVFSSNNIAPVCDEYIVQ